MKFRKITSLTLFVSGILLTLTSIILYIVPPGRVAYWSNWKLWGMTKTEWGNHHINIGYLFIVFSIIHIIYNWKIIVNYLKDKLKKMKVFTPEFSISLIIVAVTALGTQFSIPPFSSILNLGEIIKDSATEKYGEPPYGHAELSNIKIFSKNVGIDLKVALERLKNNKIKFTSEKQSLQDIAQINNITPKNIFNIIKPENSEHGKKDVFPVNPRPGMGKVKLSELALKYNLDINKILMILSKKNINASPEMTFKEIAAENNTSAQDIYHIIQNELKE